MIFDSFMKKFASEFFAGVGKGNIRASLDYDELSGYNVGGDDLKTDKTLLDRERNPKDFAIGHYGPEFTDDSNPHVRY